MKRGLIVFSVAFLSSIFRMAGADPIVFESGAKKVQLLELFTSEGCSSCPPAEASLSRLVNDTRLWREFVPVAFHVDYWDRLGWKDPFSLAESTKRQETYATNWNAEGVYTPAFVLDGREWRSATIPVMNDEAPGALKAAVRRDSTVVISFDPVKGSSGTFEVYLARLGFGLSVNVRAGENNGRSLKHDFVVLSLAHEKLASGAQELRLAPASDSVSRSERAALAVWITNAGDIRPIQATGGWLPCPRLSSERADGNQPVVLTTGLRGQGVTREIDQSYGIGYRSTLSAAPGQLTLNHRNLEAKRSTLPKTLRIQRLDLI